MRHSFLRDILLVLASTVASALARGQRLEPSPSTPFSARQEAWTRHREMAERSPYRGLEWRNIGPTSQGGRVVDIEFVPGSSRSYYVAYASGGLWRTDNAGQTFRPLFDEQPTLIMGDLAVDPLHPERIWVGTGENNSSRSSYGGHGVFRSDDGGRTFQSMGLGAGDRVGRIVVDPRDGDRVFVALLGPLYGPGGLRGIQRTRDGGKTWEAVLPTNETTGGIDLAIDPRHPDRVWAATWDRLRRPEDFRESGPGSALWKSEDGGDTWARVEGGLPSGERVGRIGLALAPSAESTLYVCIDDQEVIPEAELDLGGAAISLRRLRRMTKDEFLELDPEDIENFLEGVGLGDEISSEKAIQEIEKGDWTPQTLIEKVSDANAAMMQTDIRGLSVWRSDDLGVSWRRTHERPIESVTFTYGYYFGQIRVAPDDADRVYTMGVPLIASDDGGKTWRSIQGRGVHADHHALWIDPADARHLLVGNDGGLDQSFDGGETWTSLDSQPVGQFYTVTLDDQKPYRVYGGLQDNGCVRGSSRNRADRSGDWESIGGGDGMFVLVDPRDAKIVYTGSQFGSYRRQGPDGGDIKPKAEKKSPPLRFNWCSPVLLSPHNADIVWFGSQYVHRSLDRGKNWKRISEDLTRSPRRGDVPFATVTTLSESPLVFGRLWAGTDDGQLWTSPDGGVTWQDRGAGLPADRWVSRVIASRHEEGRVYVTLNGYRDDDATPYVYRSEDAGVTWTAIAQGLPQEAVNVIREDPRSADRLWLGTDGGVYCSGDGGKTWEALTGGMPRVPVHDLAIHERERELVAATHGRSIFVLDVRPIQDLDDAIRAEALHVFPTEDSDFSRAWRSRPPSLPRSDREPPTLDFTVWSREAGPVEVTVRAAEDRVVARFERVLLQGLNRVSWDYSVDAEAVLAMEKARQEAKPPADRKGIKGDSYVQEALRLGWDLHCPPGDYKVEFRRGEDKSSVDWKMKAPARSEGRSRRREEEEEEEEEEGR